MDSCDVDNTERRAELEHRRRVTNQLFADVLTVAARVEAAGAVQWDSPAAMVFTRALAAVCADLRQAGVHLDDSAWELARAAATS